MWKCQLFALVGNSLAIFHRTDQLHKNDKDEWLQDNSHILKPTYLKCKRQPIPLKEKEVEIS